MNLQTRNKVHTWVVRILMCMVLVVALCTFYFFMIQSSFGLKVSNSREAKKDLMTLACYPNGNVDQVQKDITNIVDNKLDIKNYMFSYTCDKTCIYKKGVYDMSNNDVCFVSERGLSLFKPTIVEGSLKWRHIASKERFRIHNPNYNLELNDVKQRKYVDTVVTLVKCGAMIPRSLAEELFGEGKRAVGRTIRWCDKINYHSEKVICVYEDFPNYSGIANSIYLSTNDGIAKYVDYDVFKFNFDMNDNRHLVSMLNINSLMEKYIGELPLHEKQTVVVVNEPKNYDSIPDSVIVKKTQDFWTLKVSERVGNVTFSLYPICEEFYRYDHFGWFNFSTSVTFLFLALIVVIMAFICQMNITLTSVPLEMKNICIRMVLGTSRRYIWFRQTVWHVFMSIGAFLVSMFIIGYIDSNNMFYAYQSTSIKIEDNMVVAVITLVASITIGTLCGLCSAFYSTSAPMDRVLKAKVGMDRRSRMVREVLLGVQFFITLIPIHIYMNFPALSSFKDNDPRIWVFLFFIVSSMFILFVTLFCMLMQENRYMYRSKAIRCVLGTTKTELFITNITHYAKFLLQVTCVFVLCYIGIYFCAYYFNNDGQMSFGVFCVSSGFIILFYNLCAFFVVANVIVLTVFIHSFFAKETDLASALKTE